MGAFGVSSKDIAIVLDVLLAIAHFPIVAHVWRPSALRKWRHAPERFG